MTLRTPNIRWLAQGLDDSSVADAQAALASSGYKPYARVATVAPLSATRVGNILTANEAGLLNTAGIDGVNTLALTDLVLVRLQTLGQDNGLWAVLDLGSEATPWRMQRADCLLSSDQAVPGFQVTVLNGNTEVLSLWVLANSPPIVLNDTALVFQKLAQYSPPT